MKNDKKFKQQMVMAVITIILIFTAMTLVARAATPIATGFRDLSYPPGTGGTNDRITGEKPESKLWFNDGRWWGSLWSISENSYTIHWLNLTTNDWIDTATKLDTRNNSKADALWDNETQKLYVVSHVFSDSGSPSGNPAEWGKLFRYSYDLSSRSYTLDSGFTNGISVTQGTNETLVLEKDSNDRLWVTYVESGEVIINYSNATGGGDDDWATPIMLPVGDAADVSTDDISSLIAYNGFIGVMWSQQSGSDKMYFAVHDDTDLPTANWQEIVAYDASSDDHISLKSLQVDSAGQLYAVVKTSLSSSIDPKIVLLACTNSPCTSISDWSAHSVNDGTGSPTRPILLIDEENEYLYVVFTKSSGSDNINYKETTISNISFIDDDLGTPLIASGDYVITDPTSTKQNLNNSTGLVVLAGTHTAASATEWYYFHNCLPLDGADKCYMPAYAPTVTATLTGVTSEDVLLDWSSSHDNAANLQYQVYESSDPYFTPDSLSPVETVSVAPWSSTRAGTAGNPVNNRFFIIQAANYNLTTPGTAVSNRVGEFDFALESN